MSARAGRGLDVEAGILHGLAALRPSLMTLGVYLLPKELNLARAQDAFTPEGALKDAKVHDQLVALMQALLERLR